MAWIANGRNTPMAGIEWNFEFQSLKLSLWQAFERLSCSQIDFIYETKIDFYSIKQRILMVIFSQSLARGGLQKSPD